MIWIAFLRGINVGGNHSLPMKELAALLEQNGCRDVKTYIQSGNVVFKDPETDSTKLATTISDAIHKNHGFQPHILLLKIEELEKAASSNPFPQAETAPKSLHLYFLSEKPENPNIEGLNKIKINNEAFHLKEKVFYLHTPDGFGTSKLANKAEKLLGVKATARNWNTVSKMLELTKALK
jgi:uncharacterized protein (DUF1697 family)